MGTCPVLPRSRHTDMSPCCASPVEERSVVTAIAGSARCRLRLIDSEPELRPVCRLRDTRRPSPRAPPLPTIN